MPTSYEHNPNEHAPVSGRYELLNVFGTGTGEAVCAGEGERLPAAPRGYRWRLVAVDEPLEVARRRILEAEERVARQETLIRRMERRGHAQIAQIGRNLLSALEESLLIAHDYIERLKQIPR